MDGVTLTFTYNADGIRTSKTVGGSEHIYHLNGTQIITETWTQGQSAMIYLYDAEGAPVGMMYRNSTYPSDTFDTFWFEKNLQGDIVAVYDAAGTKLISYTYDAWGNFATTYHNDCTASDPANLNPFRYRGYYYDFELEMYYLQSRYYDPVVGRFISMDKYVSTGQSLVGFNMFAYCNNNPVNLFDRTGESSKSAFSNAMENIGQWVIDAGQWTEDALEFVWDSLLEGIEAQNRAKRLEGQALYEAFMWAMDFKEENEEFVGATTATIKMGTGTRNIVKGFGLILVPVPTPADDVAGVAKITQGVIQVCWGLTMLIVELV